MFEQLANDRRRRGHDIRAQLGRLFESAGLKLERFRELKPAPSGGKLTVSLWLGLKPASAAKKRKAGAKVEAAA